VKDPWAILFEAVYRSKLAKRKVHEALSYLEQAEDYFNAGSQGWRLNVKPVLLYYSMLNLAKCLLIALNPALDMAQARHGLSAAPQKTAILADLISVKSSLRYVNVFGELMKTLEGGPGPTFNDLQVRHLLPQILPAHRLWTYACGKTEKFLAVADIQGRVDQSQHHTWLRLTLNAGETKHITPSISTLVQRSHPPGEWRQVRPKADDNDTVVLEQAHCTVYQHRPLDCIHDLFQKLRPTLWCAVTSVYPYRNYYLFLDQGLGRKRLPQWAAMYALFYYLSDLTRYRPQHFDRFLESKYGPQIESILDECPRQFLYLMASELLQREVAPAALA